MPHIEYLQQVHRVINFTPPDTEMQLHDIQMPKCGPKQICNIWGITTAFDNSSNNIRWVLLLSKEPSDRFTRHAIHTAYMNDVFYYRAVWTLSGGRFQEGKEDTWYPYPIAYPYDRMRAGTRTSSIATGTTWNIIIHYTIEAISKEQLTAITIRRGTVAHARAQGPEPGA